MLLIGYDPAMAKLQSRITAELFVIPIEDAYLVYAPLRQAAFVANRAVVNWIADFREDVSNSGVPESAELIEFLTRLQIIDGGDEPSPVTTHGGVPKPTTVTLFLTTACNLRCTYCYASAGDTPIRTMSVEVARQGIDFIIANALEAGQKEIEVAYHGGGEPTTNWKTLTESLTYARQAAGAVGLSVHAAMATNGMLSNAKIDWIVENLDGVSISFDGLPEAHDAHRLNLLGKGSSAQVMHTIRRFDAANFAYGLRLTVTKEHIPLMEASIRFICTNFAPHRIQVEPAYQLGRWSEAPSAETADFIDGFRAAQAVARSCGQEITFSGARVGTLSNHFCGITQDSFCLTADGQVSACYETFIEENEWAKTFFYGRYEHAERTYRFSLPILNNLRQQSVENRPFCDGCFAKWTCGGDCYHKSLTVNGAGEFRGTDRCHIIRELTKDQILDKIGDGNGILWQGDAAVSRSRGKEMLT
jgi:uncharacterized protein